MCVTHDRVMGGLTATGITKKVQELGTGQDDFDFVDRKSYRNCEILPYFFD